MSRSLHTQGREAKLRNVLRSTYQNSVVVVTHWHNVYLRNVGKSNYKGSRGLFTKANEVPFPMDIENLNFTYKSLRILITHCH